MLIYLIIFILSILFYNVACKSKGFTAGLSLSLAILIPSLVAAYRDVTVGTDIGVYAGVVWEYATMSKSILSLQEEFPVMEPGYLIFNYLASRICADINFYFFIHQLVLCSSFLLLAYKYKDNHYSYLLPVFYFFFFYNECLSMLRMSITLSVAIWVVHFYFKRKYIYAGALFPLVLITHGSGVFLLLIPLVKYVCQRWGEHKLLLYCMSAAAAICVYYGFQMILGQFISGGYLITKYEMYMDQQDQSSHKIDLVLYAGLLFSIIKYTNKNNRNKEVFDLTCFLLYISLVFIMFGSIVEVANRVVYYIICTIVLLLPQVAYDNIEKRKIISIAIILFVVHYLYLAFTHGIAETIPYTSKNLGI